MSHPKKCEFTFCDGLHANAVEGDLRFNGWRCPEHRLSFSRALELLKEGHTITRDMERGVHVKLERVVIRSSTTHVDLILITRGFYMPEPWCPTQDDLLSNDWMVVP